MKRNILGIAFLAVIAMNTTVLQAQKAIETSAVLEYRKYGEAMMGGDIEGAKKALIKAKDFIDQSSAHEDTKESPKTLYHKGEIYAGFMAISVMANDPAFAKLGGENPMLTSVEAFKKGYAVSDKYDGEIKESIYRNKMQVENITGMLYQAGNFGEAMNLYDFQVKLSDAINEIDTLSMFNAGVCAEKAEKYELAAARYKDCAKYGYRAPEIYAIASSMLRKAGKVAEAKEIIAEGRKKYPSDRAMLLELVNTNLDEGNSVAAEQSLQEAIAADPNNKQLYYTIGTIYLDLKQNDKAEAALNKAIELDPNYADAQYQLGAHLVGIAGSIKEEASRLKFGDPKFDTMMAESDAYYKKSLIPLEAYILASPNDKDVLNILFQIHKNLKNTEKAGEYKRRADAIK